MEENNLGVQDDDTYDTFVERLERDERLAKFDYFTIKTVFDRVSVLRSFHHISNRGLNSSHCFQFQLHARALRIKKEERRKAEKRVRIQIDDLRYAFKKLDPPVDLEASYEDVSISFHVLFL
jgi:pre-mRNA-processing factor 40